MSDYGQIFNKLVNTKNGNIFLDILSENCFKMIKNILLFKLCSRNRNKITIIYLK